MPSVNANSAMIVIVGLLNNIRTPKRMSANNVLMIYTFLVLCPLYLVLCNRFVLTLIADKVDLSNKEQRTKHKAQSTKIQIPYPPLNASIGSTFVARQAGT